MEIVELIDNIVGPASQGKCKNTIGFFVEKKRDGEEPVLLEEFMVEKPVIFFSDYGDSSVGDSSESGFFGVEFVYKSRRDEDMKQQWQFFDRFVKRVNETNQDEEPPVLSISIIPISLRGKYSVLIDSVLPDSLLKVEYAGELTCSIKALAFKEDVSFLKHDDDLVDPRHLEEEVSREIEAELDQQYGDVSEKVEQ